MTREQAREKAKHIVSKMTLEECASQLRYDSPAIKRLQIPAYNWWNEALHGVARGGVATSFPQAIGMAATFDTELLQKAGDVVATEGRAKYNGYAHLEDRDIYKGLTFWSPNINIFRDPRWGRGHETFGEDPYLTSRLGVAYVKGIQGEGEYLKATACAKHFAAHSGPEAVRHEFNVEVNKKDLYETYLPAFEALVKEADVEGVMGAYTCLNGLPTCAHKEMMDDVLRKEWGFEGYYVSDCWAIRDIHEGHGITNTAEESAAMALKAGCDLNCGVTYLHLLKAYKKGLVTEEEIRTAAERLFTTRYLLGMFEPTEYDKIPYEMVECKEHLEIADQLTRESIVLLKNDGLLPLSKEYKTVGVIGPNANSRAALVGNYHGTSSKYITLLEGIQEVVGDDVRVLYSEGCHLYKDRVEHLAYPNDRLTEAMLVAEHSDVVILCVGLDETLEGEEGDAGNSYASGDKETLMLPECQRLLMDKILTMCKSYEKPVVVCMMAGSSVDLNEADEKADAIVQVWYPGARGGKQVARMLYGEYSPSGKLPVTFYGGLEDLPAFEDYSMKGRTYRYYEGTPLYPFGYGLTYGKVVVNEFEVVKMEEGVSLKITVENVGDYDTGEVVQVYVKNEESRFAPLHPVLCGFQRVFVEKGKSQVIEIQLGKEAFSVVDDEGKRVLDGGRFTLYVGVHQPDKRSCELSGTEEMRKTVDFLLK